MMKGKVVPLKPRSGVFYHGQDDQPWGEIVDFVQPQIGDMEICLHRELNKSPALIKDTLVDLVKNGERYCPALFLIIAKLKEPDPVKVPRLAASLEALNLGLKVHRSVENKDDSEALSPTEAILAGDFFFSLALTLAGDVPIFIKGMSEIIARVVSSEISKPTRHVYFQAWRKAYLKRISDGSASMMALCCTLGAWYAGLEPWQNEALAYYGHYLGMGMHLKKELKQFDRGLSEKHSIPEITLPLIYILEQSPRREDVLAALNKSRATSREWELFKQENERVNATRYMEKVIESCYVKSNEFLELLGENINKCSMATLKNFMQLDSLLV